ncbi:MAG: hypothetical protein JXA57_03495, partial [Armatimonadetes bacterium]|nr:hypothetical protein [Armatimonadota bacterium]
WAAIVLAALLFGVTPAPAAPADTSALEEEETPTTPDPAQALFDAGHAHYQADELEAAVEDFRAGLALTEEGSSKWAYAHFALGRIYADLGPDEQAIEHFQNALSVWDDGPP